MATTAPGPPAPTAAQPRARRIARVAARVALGVLAVLFAIWLVLFVTKGRFLKHPFESVAGRLTNRTVTVGGDFRLYFSPLRLTFYAEKLSVSNPGWATRPYLFTAERIDSRIAPLSLLFGKRRFHWLDLTDGAVDLEWNAAHDRNTWTFSEKKGSGKPLDLPRIDRATIAGTTVRYRDPRMRLETQAALDTIRSTDARIGQAVGVTGSGVLRDTPFTLVARLLSPDTTVARGRNQLAMRARAAGNAIDVTGTLPSLAQVEGVPLAVRARGRNLAALLGIIGVAIPNTRTYRLRAQLVQQGQEYRFTRLAGTFGDSDLAGRLTVTNGDRLHLDSRLETRRLDIVDAAPFIGYNPDIVATKGAVAAAAATGAAPARLLPDAELPVATMQRFDADLVWHVAAVRSRRVPVSDVDLTLKLADGRLALSPLTFAMARGNVASDLVFDTRQRPSAIRYDIRLAPTPLGRLLAGYGVAEAGTTGTIRGRIQLAGRGDSLHDSLATANGRIAFVIPAGSLWTRNVQLAELDIGTFMQKMFADQLKEPVRINCGLVAFTVRGGLAAADPILIDTTKNVILGRGGFSFRSEGVDIAVRADAKKFSLFSGQSPVGITGTFAQPGLNVITPQLLARAGAGLGLAVVATPLAGILAFVDPGDAKAAQCGPVLAARTAAAQRTDKGEPRTDLGDGRASTATPAAPKRKKFLGIF
ncbi:MAG: AsmA family protein [Sphingomonas sp.]|uniref:AsmA family protein n=2 Tax=Sphingomonas adhaesiva TaxID=28212 RepID=A0A2A4I6P4_9SPHN|nr:MULTISPECIES: AsmA family protein [Sphingomonas]PCG13798.1 AsmA family protein [Sphingomonas adhaesiva]PZU73520.1 MAG: AsmA family protein [Sphingomonas sp.]